MSFSLDPLAPVELNALLREHLPNHASVAQMEVAGPGNMNLTLRATLSDGRRIIVKQARPWVEKFPSIPAPTERIHLEALFYQTVQSTPRVAERMPRLLLFLPGDNLMILEDLGEGTDYSSLYDGEILTEGDLTAATDWLQALHRLSLSSLSPQVLSTLRNRAMRALNHEYIFVQPFAQGPLAGDRALKARLHELGQGYLRDGEHLLHGDFYPGSWLKAAGQFWVLDPEFAYLGDPAFDYGVLLAHLVMSHQPTLHLDAVLSVAPTGSQQMAGAEILRRLHGVAQLPLHADEQQLAAWTEQGRQWVLS